MKGYKKLIFVMIVVVLGSISCIKLKDINLVLYESYVSENSNKIGYIYNDETIELTLSWINEKVTKGPYSLFLAVDVKNNHIKNIYISNMDIISSSGKEYLFTEIKSKPFLIYNTNKEDDHLKYDKENSKLRYYYFKDKFDFDFHNKEEFTLKINLHYEGENINKEKQVEVRFVPLLEEVRVPLK